jgi:hypothetical protein
MSYNADQLVSVYIKLRDKKEALQREMQAKVDEVETQMHVIELELLEICKATGQSGGKTEHGSFRRTVNTQYRSNNWPKMYEFIKKHDAPELLQQRIHQTNFKQFLEEHPDEIPEGLDVESRYSIIVRRATRK